MANTIVTGYLMVITLLLVCLLISIVLLSRVSKFLRSMETEVSKITAEDLLDPKPRRITAEELAEPSDDGPEEETVEESASEESDTNETTGDTV